MLSSEARSECTIVLQNSSHREKKHIQSEQGGLCKRKKKERVKIKISEI